jgi:SOS-response transcriptional repressor LexA
MKNPWKSKSDFALHLRNRRLELGKSQEEVSAAIGKSPSYMYQVERGRAIPSAEVLIELSRIYREDPADYLSARAMGDKKDKSLEFWKRLLSKEAKGVYIAGSRRVPVMNLARTKEADFDESGLPQSGFDHFALAHTKDDSAFYVRAVGDSMSPHIEENDLVLIEPNASVENGDIVFARTEEGPVVKRLHITSENRIMLLSLNTNYPPLEVKHRRGFRSFKASRISREL